MSKIRVHYLISLVALHACGAASAFAQQTPAPAAPPPAPIPGAPAPTPAPIPAQQAPVPAPAATPSIPVQPMMLWKADQLGKLSSLTDQPDWSKLSALSKTLTAEEFDAAVSTIYLDQRTQQPPWQRDALGVTVPTGTTDGASIRIDFRQPNEAAAKVPRRWRTPEELPPLQNRPVLSDLRIALDPGHIGGQFARMEERYLTFNPKNPNEAVMEGEHVLTVAQLVKAKLEALGAKVFLVRETNEPVATQRPSDLRNVALNNLIVRGIPNPPETYGANTGPLRMNTIQWESELLFYRTAEIHARAKKVNEQQQPDFVVCLHLNAEPWGPSSEPQYSPNNHMHALINGCYAREELMLQDVRHAMMHRLFLRMTDVEKPLAEAVTKALARSTGLPPYVYMTPNARLASENGYVYARNLLANRIYDCPVIYLEPYVMNNQETYQRLLQGPYEGRTLTNGRLRTSIYQDYANGVVDGLVDYFKAKRK